MSDTATLEPASIVAEFDERQIVRESLAFPRRIPVSEWADQNIRLSEKDSPEPGLWHTSRTPYLREILDSFGDVNVQVITMMAGTQLGKTMALFITMQYAPCEDPGNGIYVMPTEKVARGIMETRIKPLIEQARAVRNQVVGEVEDIDQLGVEFNRMFLTIAWANSPASLASRPCRYVWFDEVDKYPKYSGREADPIKLGTERTKNFWNRKIIQVSSPTTPKGYINREYLKSDRRQFNLPCPHCGNYAPLRWSQVKWPEGERDPNKIQSDRLAWYECGQCFGRIEDRHKKDVLARGVWCPEGCYINGDGIVCGDIPRTTHRGYWINSLYSPWLTFSDAAKEFLESKDYPEKLMNFVNSWLAETWDEKIHEPIGVDDLIQLKSTSRAGFVPQWAVALFSGIDVQHDRIYFVIRAYGYGERNHLVLEGCCLKPVYTRDEIEAEKKGVILRNDFNELDEVCVMASFPIEGTDRFMPVHQVCIDSGHRTDEVYLYCRRHGDRVRAVKGAAHTQKMTANFQPSRVERQIHTREMQGKFPFVVWLLNRSYYLDKIQRLRTAQPALESLHASVTSGYLKQATGFQKVIERNTKGVPMEVWKEKVGMNGEVHFADADYYCAAAADMRGASLWVPPVPQPKPKEQPGLRTPDGRPFLITERE